MRQIPEFIIQNMVDGHLSGSLKDWLWVSTSRDTVNLYNTETGYFETNIYGEGLQGALKKMYDTIVGLENLKKEGEKLKWCSQQEDKDRIKKDVRNVERENTIGRAGIDLVILTSSFKSHQQFKFYLSQDKRKTTCVIHDDHTDEYLVGRSYVSKGDKRAFAIGAIIALRRALNLPVPKEYLNLPKEGE